MTTQMNFQGGVNKKTTPSTASQAAAEAGEAKSVKPVFPCECSTITQQGVKSGPQTNFPN
jgi:hypothetical protein